MNPERDLWLQQALRHAPDHDVPVPGAVRDTILNAARAAVRRPEPTQTAWWQRLIAPLMQPAGLGYSGAIMALLVVGLWGLDRLDRPALAPEAAPVLAAPTSAAASIPSALSAARVAAARPAKKAPGPVKLNEVVAQDLARADTRAAHQTEAQTRAKAEPPEATSMREEAMALAAEASPPLPTGTPTPAPAATPAPPPAPALTMASAAAKPVASAAPPASPAPAAALKAAAALSRSRLKASPSVEVLGLLQQGLAADPAARWQTERGQGPYGAAQRLWLLQLQQATAGLWREAVSDPGHPATVQWSLREGGQADISLADAVWLRWKGVTYTAPLSDATAYALRRLSEDWH